MLSFLAPGYLVAALVAAAGLVAAHFIVRRQPRAMALPTARFVPDAPVLTTGWARVPSDLLPLLLRMLCVLLAGLALAGPFFQGRGHDTAKVILADRSRAVADSAEVSDSIAAVRAPGDVVIQYGSSLSAALVAATRAASRLRDAADSAELVIVSSFAAEQLDAATERVRREWPGRARLVRVAAATVDSGRRPTLVGDSADPLAVALAIARPAPGADVWIVRRDLTAADSSWTAAERGRVLVHWPASTAPAGFIARTPPAPVAGLVGDGPAVLAIFQRRWRYVPALGSAPVAWWIDGDVAAAETALGGGCVRSVAVPVSGAGDFVLRPDFHALVDDLVQPCGGAPSFSPIPPAPLAALAGPRQLAPASAFAQPRAEASGFARWLLIASLACALLELLPRARRRTADVTLRGEGDTTPARKVA